MKRYCTAAGVVTLFVFCLTLGDALAGKKLLDDFSGKYMDPAKWQYREFVREVAGGKLVLKLGNEPAQTYIRNGVSFQNPSGINKIACAITVVDVKPDTGPNPVSFARIGGVFYSVNNTGGATGDIWAEVQIGDRGNGLEAFYEVERALDDNFKASTRIGSGTLIPPGTLQLGVSYPVELEYTSANDIIFRVAGQSGTFPDAGWKRPPVTQTKHLGAGVDVDDSSGKGYISALFDNVYINNEAQAYDTFNSAFIDPTKWNRQEYVREISNGKLRMRGRICNPAGNNEGQRVDISSAPVDFDRHYIEARILVKSDTQVPTGEIALARFGGYFYNDSRGPGSGQSYNEGEGDVWIAFHLFVQDNGQLKIVAWGFRSNDAQGNDWKKLFWEELPGTINYNTEYTLSIRFTGSTFIFKCTSLKPFIYKVKTPIYDPFDNWAGFQARVFAGPGQCGHINATFDDVKIYTPGTLPALPLLLFN